MANALTAARVLLIFVVIGVWSRDRVVENVWLDLAMVPVLAWAIFMDALDGWAARRFHEESRAGALFDIAGDRIVELALWTFFAIRRDASGEHLVSYWVPIVIITRTVLTDMIRSVAFGEGKTAFGAQGMQVSAWARQVTASRWSRGLYGVLKAVSFCALGGMLAWSYLSTGVQLRGTARQVVDVIVYCTVLFALVRAIPVLWEGRRFFRTDVDRAKGVRTTLLVVMITACVAVPAAAQSPRDSVVGAALTKFRPGRPIQVGLLRSRWTGRYERVGGDTLFFASRGQPPMAIRFNAIDTLWRQDDRFRRGALIGGITLGILGGFGLTVLAAAAGNEGGAANNVGAEDFFGVGLAWAAGLGVVGALTGGWIGSAFKRWVVVYQ